MWKFFYNPFSPYNGLTHEEKVLKAFSIKKVRHSTDMMAILPASYTKAISRLNRKGHKIVSEQVKKRDKLGRFSEMVTIYRFYY